MMDGQLDIPFVSMLEQKNEKSRFVRVDSDVIENLIRKEDDKKPELSADEQAMASTLFKSQIPALSLIHISWTRIFLQCGFLHHTILRCENDIVRFVVFRVFQLGDTDNGLNAIIWTKVEQVLNSAAL